MGNRTNLSSASPDAGIYPRILIDRFGRTFNYLRIALNEMCNLRCIYCMPEGGIPFKPKNEIMTPEEILRIVTVVSELGVNKIRFTGGEPLLRKDLVELVEVTSFDWGIRENAKKIIKQCTTQGASYGGNAEALKKTQQYIKDFLSQLFQF